MTKTITEKFDPKSVPDPIKKIMEDHKLSINLWYPEVVKIKDGNWDSFAKKRDQELTWTLDSQTEEKNGKNPQTKKIDKQQFMEGYSKHFPEFMKTVNKTYSITVTFRRFPIEMDILEEYKEIIKSIPPIDVKVVNKFRKRIIRNGIAAEIATVDAHLGKLAWEKETGYRDFDLNIAVKDYKYVSEKGADYIAPHKPEKIIVIIGNDMYHMDNMAGRTTKGEHTLDVDGRITKVHRRAFAISRDNIIMYRKIAPVEIIWIPGNHDFLASFMLCHSLKEHFRNDHNVVVDIGDNPRKARLWGNLLVGWNHAIKGKYSVWVNELPQQFPKLWGESKLREWHCGDQHKKVNTRLITPVNTVGGVTIRQLTALSPVDKWHTDNAFTDAVPGGDVLMWSKEEGVFGNYTLWTGQYDSYRNNLLKNQ